jgi:hypothetical protein
MQRFETKDGYAFYLQGGKWMDSLDPATVDMAFDAGPDGLPVDANGLPLEGRLVAIMSFAEFQGTCAWHEDLSVPVEDEALKGIRGYTYCGVLYIEDATAWPTDAPGFGKGRWYTLIGRSEYQSDNLEDVERPLYAFAVSEGYAPLSHKGG